MHTGKCLLQTPSVSYLDTCRSLSIALEKLNATLLLPTGYQRSFSRLDCLSPFFFHTEHELLALALWAQLGQLLLHQLSLPVEAVTPCQGAIIPLLNFPTRTCILSSMRPSGWGETSCKKPQRYIITCLQSSYLNSPLP